MREGELKINPEIYGGLKAAIEKGEDLRSAMMSFYQAGYAKTEIEEQAKILVMQQRGLPEIKTQVQSKPANPEQKKPAELQKKIEPMPVMIPQKLEPVSPPPKAQISIQKEKQDGFFAKLFKKEEKTPEIKTTETKSIPEFKPLVATPLNSIPNTFSSTSFATASQQKVSSYEEAPKKKGNFFILLLIIFLFILLGFLVGMIFFKEPLTNIINSLIS